MRSRHKLGIAVFAIMLAILLSSAAFAAPVPVDLTPGTPTTKGFFSSGLIGAQGGNATSLNASTETQTVAWQGFYGEVIGDIRLGDNSCNKLYSWSLITENGTVFASTDSSVEFSNIAGQEDCTIDEDMTGTGSDRVNKTFTNASIGRTIAGITIDAACRTYTYVNNASQNVSFEELILTDDGGNTSIYTTTIEDDKAGFNGGLHDYQIIVPETRNETTTTYYFYAELK